MEYREFRDNIKKVSGKRVHKITNSIGTQEIYRMIRKDKWKGIGKPVTDKLFYAVIRKMNCLLAQELVNGRECVFPCRMGTLEVRKRLPRVELKDGKLRTNLPIDWNATLELWYSDSDSRESRTLVRSELSEIFKIVYLRTNATYRNKLYYQFRPSRKIKQQLSRLAKEGSLDAYLLKYDKRKAIRQNT